MMDFFKRPEALQPMLGETFVRALTDRDKFAPLRIGADTWSRQDVARMGVVHMKACSILSHVAKKLGVTNTNDLYKSTSPYTFADQPVGVTTMYVMFAAFRAKGLSVEAWYAKGQKAALVSFLRLKARELEAERRTKRGVRHLRRAS